VSKLVLIPIGNTNIDATEIANALNATYKPAIAEFEVELKPAFTPPSGAGGLIAVGTSGLLSNYTADMKAIISAYKKANSDFDNEAYYLFIGGTASDAAQLGYMPRAKHFGFIFTPPSGTGGLKTIAHELGHGAFHLKHTFSETSVPQNSSQNLMDYGTGTYLNKYQWDFVHNPSFVVGLFESDEDGAMKNLFDGKFIYFQNN